MAAKKKGLGRGIDSLIPEKTIPAAERELTDEDSGMETSRAERMLRMIIAMCQSEMRGGQHA